METRLGVPALQDSGDGADAMGESGDQGGADCLAFGAGNPDGPLIGMWQKAHRLHAHNLAESG